MNGARLPLFTSMRRAPRRSWLQVVRYVALGLSAFLLFVTAVGVALWRYADSRISHVAVPALVERPTDRPEPPPPLGTLNVLVVGTDSREGLTDAELEELGTTRTEGNRSDTIMLVQVTPARERAVIVSFPRDLKVQIPGEGVGKINSAVEFGGADLLVETVEDYTGVELDHYVEVDLAGFLDLVDLVGGVEVCLDEPLVDPHAGANIAAGCHVLTGADASGYVRARYTDPRGDIGRIERQQTFLRAAMQKVTSARTLFDPLRLKRLIDVVGRSVTTDQGLGLARMYRIARGLRSLEPADVDTRVVPATWRSPYMHAEVEQAEALFQSLRDVSPLPGVGATVAPELTAADVGVMVLNGDGSSGLAGTVQAYLEERDFTVVGTGNVEGFGVERSQIGHTADGAAAAELLAEFLPAGVEPEIAPREDVPEGADVVLVVGEDWLGAGTTG